jgi:hypothetical protein
MFPKNRFVDVFEASGLSEIQQDVRGLAQFVSATKE